MNKNTLIGTLSGLIIGGLIGFWGANYLNKNSVTPTGQTSLEQDAGGTLPQPDPNIRPPAQQKSAEEQNKMLSQVQDKLDNAKKKPDDALAQLEAGDMYIEIQRYDEALGFYTKAAQLKPDSFDAQANIGRIYFEKKEYGKAGEFYQKALSIDGSNVGLRSDLGLTFFLRQPPDLERAVREYKTALGLDPVHEPTLQNLSVALKELGRDAERTAILERLRKVNPSNQLFTTKQEKS